jgi:flagellar biosynthesis component FlhA
MVGGTTVATHVSLCLRNSIQCSLGQALVAVLVEELEQLLEQLLQDEFYKLKRRLTKIRKRWVDP